jgi:hypothetical protein
VIKHLVQSCRTFQVSNAAVAATSAINSSTVDATGAHGVRFTAALGDVTTGCVLGLKIQGGAASDGSDAVDVTGATTAFTAGASDADVKLLQVEVFSPTKQYYRAVLTRTTANAVVNSIIADVFHFRNQPVTGGDVVGTPTCVQG